MLSMIILFVILLLLKYSPSPFYRVQEEDEDNDVVVVETEPSTRIVSGKAAAMAAEAIAAKERAMVPLEDRIEQFKQMLKETDVCKPSILYALSLFILYVR